MTRAEQARHYLLHEHRSPLNDIMHQADLNAEKQYCTDIENAYLAGYQQAEKDTIGIIETRISEIMGDAQPAPALRAELYEIIKRLNKEE